MRRYMPFLVYRHHMVAAGLGQAGGLEDGRGAAVSGDART